MTMITVMTTAAELISDDGYEDGSSGYYSDGRYHDSGYAYGSE